MQETQRLRTSKALGTVQERLHMEENTPLFTQHGSTDTCSPRIMKPEGARQHRKPVVCDNVQMCPHKKKGAQEHISTIARGAVQYKQLS